MRSNYFKFHVYMSLTFVILLIIVVHVYLPPADDVCHRVCRLIPFAARLQSWSDIVIISIIALRICMWLLFFQMVNIDVRVVIFRDFCFTLFSRFSLNL